MARMTIYVPDELKARMDRSGDRVNWSAEAQRAFERVLASEGWRNMTDEMEQAVARLGASKRTFEEGEQAAGTADGRHWAMKDAEYEELVRMRGVQEEGWDDAEDLGRKMLDPAGDDRNSWWEWWGDEQRVLSLPYAKAFVAAALDVFADVEKRI